MGFLETIASEVLRGVQGPSTSQGSALVNAVLGMLQGGPQGGGGLGALVQQFEQAGLGTVVQSWISTGQNQPVSVDQLRNALGNDTVTRMAQQAGLSTDQGLDALAQILPDLIDRATPNGRLQDGNDLFSAGLDLLRKSLA